MSITILQPGLFTTVQDLGRTGYQQFGVPVAGSVDRRAHRLANLLVGNTEDAALLECTIFGPEIRFETETAFAVTGAAFSPTLNGHPVPMYRAVRAEAGSVLTLGSCTTGCRGYIALSGGIDVPEVMGSRSTYTKAKLGGFEGRKLQTGDALKLFPRTIPENLPARALPQEICTEPVKNLRVVLGPQEDMFTPEGLQTFLSATYTVSKEFDRMGCRFEGPVIQHKKDANILSDGIVLGSVQVPGSGQPIVMLADRQTTGGYTKIATVISCDLPKLAQCKSGDAVRFTAVDVEEAQALYLENEAAIRAAQETVERHCSPSREFSITVNGSTYAVTISEIPE